MANNKRCSGTMGCAAKGPMKKNFGGPVTATERAYNDMKAMDTDLSRATGNAMLGTGMHPYRLIPNDKMKPTAVSKFFRPTNNQVKGERNFAGGNVNEEGPQGEVQGDGGAHDRREADARYPVDLAETMVVGDVGEGAGSGGNLFGSREISERTEVIIRDPGEDVDGVHNYAGGGATKMSADEGAGAGGYTPTPQPTLTPIPSGVSVRQTEIAKKRRVRINTPRATPRNLSTGVFANQSSIRSTSTLGRSESPKEVEMLKRRLWFGRRGSNSSRVVAE